MISPSGVRVRAGSHPLRAWWTVLVGFALMYVPVYWWAAEKIWQDDDHAHGAIVLVVVAWLFWTRRHDITNAPSRPRPVVGSLLFGVGLLMYVVGRIFNVSILEFASQIPVVMGVLLLISGFAAVRAVWFPILYFVFMIPMPGMIVDAVTGPLKQSIADIVVTTLYHVGYPVAKQGVIITVGQYQLLVADACSGLHSMFSLVALGTLFMYVTRRSGWLHNGIMLASILPIAFVANIVRVLVLVLVTYHLGDDAGQGFLHGTAGIVVMAVALCSFFLLDSALVSLLKRRGPVAASDSIGA